MLCGLAAADAPTVPGHGQAPVPAVRDEAISPRTTQAAWSTRWFPSPQNSAPPLHAPGSRLRSSHSSSGRVLDRDHAKAEPPSEAHTAHRSSEHGFAPVSQSVHIPGLPSPVPELQPRLPPEQAEAQADLAFFAAVGQLAAGP